MRLTLRTLLAYLDDTLEPSKAKAIGQKIAESPTAQELISRIKEVVRRRRLTVPPTTGPGAKLDPNTIAEYIDSVLPADQLAEVEEIALGSDLYLAEIAACHQILTVVLSEPSLVPPTARQRMYGLVKGPEAIPSRRAGRATDREMATARVGRDEADDTLLLGLPFFSSHGSWYRALIPAGILLFLACCLVAAIWTALPPSSGTDKPVARADQQAKADERKPAVPQPAPPANDVKAEPVAAKPAEKPEPKPETKPDAKPPEKNPEPKPAETTPATQPKPEEKPAEKPAPPPAGRREEPPVRSAVQGERKVVGKYLSPADAAPSVLLAWKDENTGWKRLFHNNPVSSEDPLVSLPGYHSRIATDGVELVLAGDLNTTNPYLTTLESGVVLHASGDVNLDLTLNRGRIVFTNVKREGEAKVRLRFHDETWLLTLLEPGTKVSVTLGGMPRVAFTKEPAKDDVPFAILALSVQEGQAYLKVGPVQQLVRKGGPAFGWDNAEARHEARPLRFVPAWSQELPARARDPRFTQALAALSQNLKNSQASVEVVLPEMLKDTEPTMRILGVYCLGAVSDLPYLLEALSDEDQADVRLAAIQTLRHWISLAPDNEMKLYKAMERKYKSATAEIIMTLLHSFTEESRRRPETYEQLIEWLKSDKLPIRQLAHWHLFLLPETKDVAAKIPYNPAGGQEQREQAYELWKKRIPDGKLPSAANATDSKTPKKPSK